MSDKEATAKDQQLLTQFTKNEKNEENLILNSNQQYFEIVHERKTTEFKRRIILGMEP